MRLKLLLLFLTLLGWNIDSLKFSTNTVQAADLVVHSTTSKRMSNGFKSAYFPTSFSKLSMQAMGVDKYSNVFPSQLVSKDSLQPTNELEQKKSFFNGWSVGLNMYQISPGLCIAKELTRDKLYLLLGANYLSFALPQSAFDAYVQERIQDPTVQSGCSLNVGRAYLGVNYRSGGLLSISAGVQLNEFTGQLVFALKEDYVFEEDVEQNGVTVKGQATIPKELIGNIRVNIVDANKFAPFLGLAIGKPVPEKRIGLRLEAGIVFQGPMQLELEEKLIDLKVNDADGNNMTYLIGEADDPAETEEVSKDVLKNIDLINYDLKNGIRTNVLFYASFSVNVRLSKIEVKPEAETW